MHKHMVRIGLLATLNIAAAHAAEPLELDGVGISRDVPCNGRDVNITGNGNHIRLTGDCGAVSVYGSQHRVTLDSAENLGVSGIDNQVVAKGHVGGLVVDTSDNRVEATIKAATPPARVQVDGAEQVLQLKLESAVEMEINGADHQLDWSGEEPAISTSGAGHRIERRS